LDFLKSFTSTEALRLIEAFPVSPESETLDLEDADGRTLAEDILSTENVPPFPRSLVDGYAVKAKDTYGAKETSPSLLYVKGEVRIGEETDLVLEDGFSVYLSTGSMIPEGADSVVMQEFVRQAGDAIEVTRSVFRGENICFKGEDIEKGSRVLMKGKRLSPFDIGTLAAIGISRIPVFRRPRVSVISSGDEIVPVDHTPPPGKIRDINRHTVSSLLRREGALVSFEGITADSLPDIKSILLSSKDSDMILISGGSSKGERDLVTAAIDDLGGKILFHGINIKPGKPTVFAQLWGKPVFGLPGHPASCIVVVLRFVLPVLARLRGGSRHRLRKVAALLTTNAPSSYGIEEYVRVTVEEEAGGRYLATPVFSKSAVISSLSRASGYIIVPEGKEGCEPDEEVEVYLFE
jgi:molybdopterin molybdotransferase